jgi:hypothetical protein
MMTNAPNMMQMLGQFKANPMQFLMQRKFNVPQSMANDPNAILNHLLQTGQVNQDAVNRAYQMAQRFK